MGRNAGTPFEDLARVVFQSIVNQSDVQNIEVLHDVTLRGKHNNSHQIDVYWKFGVGCFEYETVVEAKGWKDPVDQGELFKFKTVLDDLPGQPKGIFVSRTGYQQGAVNFANAHGILLYELREADYPPSLSVTTAGWAHYRVVRMPLRGIIRTKEDIVPQNIYALGFEVDVFTPCFSNIRVNASTGWIETEYPAIDISKIGAVRFPVAFLHEINLYNDEGGVAGNLTTVFRELASGMQNDGIEEKRATHVFKHPTFIRTDSSLVPFAKIDSVSVDVKIEHRHEIRRGRMANFAQWVLRELNSGNSEWFVATPSVATLLPNKREG